MARVGGARPDVPARRSGRALRTEGAKKAAGSARRKILWSLLNDQNAILKPM